MKLAFPNGDHPEVAVGKGSFSIGGTDQDDIVLDGSIAGHAILTVDQRGITLSVDDLPADAVQVNDRPVRRRAILRFGDQIRIGTTPMVLLGNDVNTKTPPHPFDACAVDGEPARVVLRGLSGRYAGRVFPVADAIQIGNDPTADVRIPIESEVRLVVGCAGERVFLRREAGQEELDVNGHKVRHAELSPGDQITIGGERLLVEAPGFVPAQAYGGEDTPRRRNTTQVFQAMPMPKPEAPTSPTGQPEAKQPPQPGPAKSATPLRAEPEPRRWDAWIIGVCAVLSAAMLTWLFLNL